MSTAKLRRSRDVSASHPVKFENTFEIRKLAVLNAIFCARANREDLARQASDLVCNF
jgi:hypothetical protein